jgi:beta-N-acetylhexosaminidase
MPGLFMRISFWISLLLISVGSVAFTQQSELVLEETTGEYISPSQAHSQILRLAAEARGPIQPPVTPPALRDADTTWVETTLAGMTLDEKIGQMIMPGYGSTSDAISLINAYHVGGFLFLGNFNTADELYDATTSLQAQSSTPLIFSIDCEAGSGARLAEGEGTEFPMNMALAASQRTDLAFQQGVATARECRALGIQIGLGPVLDNNSEPVNPIIGIRSYSDRPDLIEEMARAYVQGAESAGLLTTFKHFPGHGATEGDSHQSLQVVNITCDELMDYHVRPYSKLLAEGVGDLVMTAHVWYPCLDPGVNAKPATISDAALNGILRDGENFDRVIVSDAFNMQGLQVVASTEEAARVAVLGGLDVILFPRRGDIPVLFNSLKSAVETDGIITEARIDESVRRILRLKSRVGMPETINPDAGDRAKTMFHPDHIAVSENIGQETIASIKVQENLLPLPTNANILCVPLESSATIFYLHDETEFTNPLAAAFPNTTVVETVDTGVDAPTRAQIVAQTAGKDYVIITSRLWKPSNSSSQNALIRDLLNSGVPVIYCSFGSPYHLRDFSNMENFFCSFSSHYSSQAEMVKVLTGESDADAEWPVSISDELMPSPGMAAF